LKASTSFNFNFSFFHFFCHCGPLYGILYVYNIAIPFTSVISSSSKYLNIFILSCQVVRIDQRIHWYFTGKSFTNKELASFDEKVPRKPADLSLIANSSKLINKN
jgi:hypothetical protein